VLAFSLFAGILGLMFRVLGWLLLALVGVPLMLVAGGLALGAFVAILHAALPLLLVIGVIWLIAHHRDARHA
jgi:hypothetical protein